jgi:hypothetical protein
MIIFLTGETGSGKTDTGWALVAAVDDIVFQDCDWFASRKPFSWKSRADVESVYRAIRSQMDFHIGEGRDRFVVTLTVEMAVLFRDQRTIFAGLPGPIHAVRLVASESVVRDRIAERGRIQKDEEARNSSRQRAEFDRLFPDGSNFEPLETTGLELREVAAAIAKRFKISN